MRRSAKVCSSSSVFKIFNVCKDYNALLGRSTLLFVNVSPCKHWTAFNATGNVFLASNYFILVMIGKTFTFWRTIVSSYVNSNANIKFSYYDSCVICLGYPTYKIAIEKCGWEYSRCSLKLTLGCLSLFSKFNTELNFVDLHTINLVRMK